MSYDRLDFSRPAQELKPHYHSTSTLKSFKSAKLDNSGQDKSRSRSRSPRGSGSGSGGEFSRKQKQRHSTGHLSQGEIPSVRLWIEYTHYTVKLRFFSPIHIVFYF